MTTGSDPLIGTLIAGRYRIKRLLGEGGMGYVYLAEHEAIEKKVAVKVLRPEYSVKPEIVARFQQEAISASRIKHPNVLDVFDFGRLDNGCFFLAMEFLEGNDLADELVRVRMFSPDRGLRVALQVCRALGAAHARGVVHRDLKPENVFLLRTGDGEEIVKIVDFGIAQLRTTEQAAADEPKRRRLTRTGMIFGTPEYMAPEQAGGRQTDLRVDVYALGIIMYEMFTGAVPFTGDTFIGVLTRQLTDPPPLMSSVCPELNVSAELQAVIMRALGKEPGDRHQSMTDFAQAILGTPEGRSWGARGPSLLPEASAPNPFGQTAPAHPTAPLFASSQPHATAAQFGPAAPAPPPVEALPPIEGLSAADLGRAQTQLDAETISPTVASRKSSLGAIFAGLVGLAVVGGAVAFAVTRAGDSRNTGSTAPSAELPRPAATSPAPSSVPAAPSSTPPAPTTSAAPRSIRLAVTTDPEGAVLTKNGFQVCDKTPCEILAQLDETLSLEARKGGQRGSAKVLAERDQKVEIKLSAPAKPAGKPAEKPCLRERMQGEIKIVEVIPCPK